MLGLAACGDVKIETKNQTPKKVTAEVLKQSKKEYKNRAMADTSMLIDTVNAIAANKNVKIGSPSKAKTENIKMTTPVIKKTTKKKVRKAIAKPVKKTKKVVPTKKVTKTGKVQEPIISKTVTIPAVKEEVVKVIEKKKEPLAELAFRRNFYDYGKITKGDKVEHKYEFTNIGETPVIIKNATATCGCTEPSYPFVAIAPGEKGYIGVVYDSKTKEGEQNAIITVTANTEPSVFKLYLNGTVLLPDAATLDSTTVDKK